MNSIDTWIKYFDSVLSPFLSLDSKAIFNERIPIGLKDEKAVERKRPFNSLEAVARVFLGAAPLLHENSSYDNRENLSEKLEFLLDELLSDQSKNRTSFKVGGQALVEAAFLAQGMLRAPDQFWHGLSYSTRDSFIDALKSTRSVKPHFNNWILFSAVIEAFLCSVGEEWDNVRVEYALQQHEQWYLGDGAYGDGPDFRWDYYNSFVIYPALLDILSVVSNEYSGWKSMYETVKLRAQRYAEVLERLIGPMGEFPPIGRSLAYRCAAFHMLAYLAWKKMLPPTISEPQVREALLAVIERTLGPGSNYDKEGWLQLGISGLQPSLAEPYISTGSLYLCTSVFVPLALPSNDTFWNSAPELWTQKRIWWLGQDLSSDKALKD